MRAILGHFVLLGCGALCLGQTGGGGKLPPHVKLVLPKTPLPAAQPAPARCAHIIAFVPPEDFDRGMVYGGLSSGSAMPVAPPMPVCREDIRRLSPANAPVGAKDVE